MKARAAIAIGIALNCTSALYAQQVYINSLDGNGQLTVNAPSNSDFTVEWASTLTPMPVWLNNWLGLQDVECTNDSMKVGVPMFYRVTCWTNGLFLRLPEGRTYTYGVTNTLGQSWTQTVSVVAKAYFPAMTNEYHLFVNREHWEGSMPSGADEDIDLILIRSSDSAAYFLDPINMGEGKGWRMAAIGTTWTNMNEYGEREVTTIEAVESVTVPAGTFSDCIKFHHEELDILEPTPEWDTWIKPGLFVVKWVDYWGGGPEKPLVFELQSWNDD